MMAGLLWRRCSSLTGTRCTMTQSGSDYIYLERFKSCAEGYGLICLIFVWRSWWSVLLARVCLHRLKNLTSDAVVIVESLRKSKTGLLEISEDQTKIRRSLSKPLPEYTEEYKDALKHKSIYMVSGLWCLGHAETDSMQMYLMHSEKYWTNPCCCLKSYRVVISLFLYLQLFSVSSLYF